MFVIHICTVMLVAVNAGENRIVGRVAMAFCAIGPLAVMLARVNGEKQGIMDSKFRWFPSWHGGMALHANVVNSGGEVVWIGGSIVISLMAGEAIR